MISLTVEELCWKLILEHAIPSGVDIHLSPDRQVSYAGGDLMCSGYFIDDPTPQLAVAMGKPKEEWNVVLLHELCHLEQWSENCPVWEAQKSVWDIEMAATDIIDSWLSGTEYPFELLDEAFRRTIDVELDCERRVMKYISWHDLPVDPRAYARAANAYVRFYNFVRNSRKWNTVGREPYNIPEICNAMPDDLNGELSFYSLTEEHDRLYNLCIR